VSNSEKTQLPSKERLTADDAHDWKKCEQLDRIYRQAYDEFAGPPGRRHAVNFDTYNRAGLIAVWNAAQDAMRAAPETSELPEKCGGKCPRHGPYVLLGRKGPCPICEEIKQRDSMKAECAHNNQRQGERGPPYCADCGEQVDEPL
jgi:hypothetical protein